MKNQSMWNVLVKNQVVAATSLALLLTVGGTTAHAQLDPTTPAYLTTNNGALTVTTGPVVIDTDAGTLTANGMTYHAVTVGSTSVFDFTGISIGSGLTVTVSGSKSLALLSTSTASVLSTIDVSGASGTITPSSPGSPVAGTGAVGGGSGGNGGTVTNTPATAGTSTLNGNGGGVVPTPDSTTYFQDGAGGGNGGAGGNGGTLGGGATGGNASNVNPKTTLVGGGGGGGGPDNDASAIAPTQAPGGGGGAGGGAVEIIARDALTVNSLTTDGGTGGGPDPADPTSDGTQYGGGGAGGTLVLGGSSLTVNTGLTADGGGVAANSSAGAGGGGAVSLIGIQSYVLGSNTSAANALGVMVDVSGGAAGGGGGGAGTAGMIYAQTVGVTSNSLVNAAIFDPSTGNFTNAPPVSQTQSGSTPGISITFGQSVVLDGGELQFAGSGTFGGSSSQNLNATFAVTMNNGTIDTQGFTDTVTSQITGAGTVTKIGSGTLILNNNNTYSGGTDIQAGTVEVANSGGLGTNEVLQESGTTLETNNTDHLITVGSALTAAGTGLDIMSGGTLVINLNGAPGSGSNDRVSVTGGATLDGNLTINIGSGVVIPPGTTTSPYSIVMSSVVSGITAGSGFTTPTVHDGAVVLTPHTSIVNNPTDNPTGSDFVVTFTSTQGTFGTIGGLTPNQTATGNYLDKISGTATGPLAALITSLDGVSTNSQALGSALNQLTPLNFAHFASSTAFNGTDFLTEEMDNYFSSHRGQDGMFVGSNGGIDYSGLTLNDPDTAQGLQEIRSRLLAWNPAPSTGLVSDSAPSVLGGVDMKDTKAMRSYNEAPANLWNVFVAGDVQLGQDFSDNAAGTAHDNSTTGEVRVGADYAITPHFLIGGLLNYAHTDVTLDTNHSSATVDSYMPGVYASYSDSGWYANAIAGYAWNSYTQARDVVLPGFDGHANSAPDGDEIVGNLDGGYDFHTGHLTYGPTLGLKYVHLDVNGYSETGLPGADLNVDRDEADSLRSRIGGRLSYVVHDGQVELTPHVDASYVHEFMDGSRGINSDFIGANAGTVSVSTSTPSRNSGLFTLGLDAKLDSTFTIFSNYTVQAGQSNYFGQAFQAGLKIGF